MGCAAGAGGDALPPAAPQSPAAFFSAFSAPTPVTDIRTDKVEQKSVSLSWQEPGFLTANGTEYEVKYYEKVGSQDWLWLSAVPRPSLADSRVLPLPARSAPRERGAGGAVCAAAAARSQAPTA